MRLNIQLKTLEVLCNATMTVSTFLNLGSSTDCLIHVFLFFQVANLGGVYAAAREAIHSSLERVS